MPLLSTGHVIIVRIKALMPSLALPLLRLPERPPAGRSVDSKRQRSPNDAVVVGIHLEGGFKGPAAGLVEGEGANGPVFAHAESLGQVLGLAQSLSNPLDQIDVTPSTSTTVTYAIATSPVPGPLPLFGAAAAFGWSRQLRARLRIRSGA
jgi:hypothetical protein